MRIRTADLSDLKEIARVEAACFPAAEAATEEEFEREVALRYPEFTEKELEKFRTLVLQVHYGYEEISEQDVQFARDEYEKLVKATVRQMKFRKKSVFYIWKGF